MSNAVVSIVKAKSWVKIEVESNPLITEMKEDSRLGIWESVWLFWRPKLPRVGNKRGCSPQVGGEEVSYFTRHQNKRHDSP